MSLSPPALASGFRPRSPRESQGLGAPTAYEGLLEGRSAQHLAAMHNHETMSALAFDARGVRTLRRAERIRNRVLLRRALQEATKVGFDDSGLHCPDVLMYRDFVLWQATTEEPSSKLVAAIRANPTVHGILRNELKNVTVDNPKEAWESCLSILRGYEESLGPTIDVELEPSIERLLGRK
jgi:hypothetical protein